MPRHMIFAMFISVLLPQIVKLFEIQLKVLDDKGNTKTESDIAITVASSVTLICKSNDVAKNQFKWTKSNSESNTFIPINQSLVIGITSARGESKLSLTDISFDKSGIYQCSNEIHSSRVQLHVYGITDFGSTHIPSESMTEYIHGIKILRNIPKIQSYPEVFCKFQVGKNSVNFVTIRWRGVGYEAYPKMFQVTESKNLETGVIISSLQMKISTNQIKSKLFGIYECSFNVLSGKSLKQQVNFSISPIITKSVSSNSVYEGDLFNITCSIVAFPAVQKENIEWRRNNQLILQRNNLPYIQGYDHEGRITFGNVESQFDSLIFSSLKVADRAVYTCFVKTPLGNDSNGLFLRVKNINSTFVPLIGICLELIVLVGIILIYERNQRILKSKRESQNKNELITDEPTPKFKDSGIRHR